MPHLDFVSVLTAGTILLALVSASLLIFGRLGLGMVVAFIAAGVLLGRLTELPNGSIPALRELSEFGVVLLLFLIGVELQPKELKHLGRDIAIWGTAQLLITGLAVGLYAWMVSGRMNTAVIVGLGVALSSTTLVMQMLKDRGDADSFWGRKVFAILVAQDLAIVPLLLLVTLLADASAASSKGYPWLQQVLIAIAMIVAIALAGRFGLQRLLTLAVVQKNDAAFSSLTLLGVFAAALAAQFAGLSMTLGAFLLGLTLSTSPNRQQVEATIEPAKAFLLALFFISIGLSLDITVLVTNWAPILFYTIVLLALKIVVMLIIGIVGRLTLGDAIRTSVTLSQVGEFTFVLFATALSAGMTPPAGGALYTSLIILSMLATPLLMRLADSAIARFEQPAGNLPPERTSPSNAD